MSDGGLWLKRLRNAQNLTQDELAERAGTTRQMIGLYEAGTSSPSLHQLDKIAAGFGMTVTELLAYRDADPSRYVRIRTSADTDAPRDVHTVDLPVYETVPAGGWSDMPPEELGTFPVLHHLAGEGRVVVRVSGTSMYPTLHDGDLILVDRTRQSPKSGEIIVAVYHGATTLKRYRRLRRQPLLQADNPLVPPIEVDDPEELMLLGVAIRLVDRDISKAT